MLPGESHVVAPLVIDAAPPADEMAALREGAAYLSCDWAGTLFVSGRDAPTFLNGLLTQEITRMPVGSARPTALADRMGHFEGDLWIAREAGWFHLSSTGDRLRFLIERLERHRFSEQVEWVLGEPTRTRWLVLGPQAKASMAIVEQSSGPELRDLVPVPALGESALRMRVRETSIEDFLIEASETDSERVRSELERAGARAVSWRSYQLRRYESGACAFGFEAGPERLVPEVGLLDRLHYDKGCFLGQETLARLHFRGGLNWRLNRVRLAGMPAIGSALLARGERVGWIAGCVRADCDLVRGLGFVHRRFHDAPAPLTTEEGIEAELLGLALPPAAAPETA